MAKISKRTLTGIIVAVVIVGVFGFKWVSSLSVKSIDPVAARAKGNPQARVQVVEFIDFECPACAHGAKLLKEYLSKHPEDIHVQVKYFPLTGHHRHAMPSALYSECAGRQGKFWEFDDLVIAAQSQWSPLISAEPLFDEFARQTGLDMDKLKTCIASPDVSKMIMDERSVGASLGIKSTPTYFINNKMVVGTQSLTDAMNTYFPSQSVPSP